MGNGKVTATLPSAHPLVYYLQIWDQRRTDDHDGLRGIDRPGRDADCLCIRTIPITFYSEVDRPCSSARPSITEPC